MVTTFLNHFSKFFLLFVIGCSVLCCHKKESTEPQPTPTPTPTPVVKTDVVFWMTKGDQSSLFQKQNIGLIFANKSNANQTIEVDTTQTYQSIDGFGYTLTGGSASLLNKLSTEGKEALLKEFFSTDSTFIGISYLRISIGASDLSSSPFTYDDMPSGQTDVDLLNFSLDKEKQDLIPILKKIIAINPDIKILGTPWSPPVWMKTNSSFIGGKLKTEYYDAYARYFVKYIQGMQAEGISIDAITPQNEPLNPYNNPSLQFEAIEQTNFIKNNLGPAFQSAGITTKIILYDHNCDRTDYPLTILNDPDAKVFVDGSAFHLYAGNIRALTEVHNAHPDKNVYFTEQYTAVGGNFGGDLNWHTKNLIIGASRNWSRNVLEWNLASDQNYEPHTNGGCTTCLGALTINGATVIRNVSYYIIAQAAKFVRPGSVRVESNTPGSLQNVAFKTPQGKKVLIVLNDSNAIQYFNIRFKGNIVTTALDGGAVGTYVW